MALVLHGAAPSPFVRKVRVALIEKGIPYELVPVLPFPPANATPEFRRMSPLGKIPALSDGDFAISDSSVICAYLERTHPAPPLYPSDARAYARALWLEEFADSRLVEATGPAFFQRVVRKLVLQQEPDEALVRKSLAELLPPALDYLEGQLDGAEWLAGGRFTVADIAAASMLQQLRHAGETLDAGRWPHVAAFAERALARPSFASCIAEETRLLGLG
ncbi:MAG: glutathione S-transferase family protein [Deltaproteobacteria bacterium]|nr:glutathione S-transferase family protein [Deltaproteobacteria bacterium]